MSGSIGPRDGSERFASLGGRLGDEGRTVFIRDLIQLGDTGRAIPRIDVVALSVPDLVEIGEHGDAESVQSGGRGQGDSRHPGKGERRQHGRSSRVIQGVVVQRAGSVHEHSIHGHPDVLRGHSSDGTPWRGETGNVGYVDG